MYSLQKFKLVGQKIHRRYASTNTQVSFQYLNAIAYQPKNVEKSKYEKWNNRNLFVAESPSLKPTFSMVLPPPNVTGKLHLGHALACTIQDVIVRYKRCTGHNVLWLPGIDHAGIATQGVVEKYLETTQGINRHQIGQNEFINEVWKWTEKQGGTIFNQLQALGCSLDWSRKMFTLDPKHTYAVNTAFLNLFKKGLIYRKKALVNWCNALRSTVSDIEVENVTINGPKYLQLPGYDKPIKFGQIYDISYKVCDSNEEVIVSTTMPETMLGDVAVAVHPNDLRYSHLAGKKLMHPFRNTPMPIIFDEEVNMNFGTGAVKITPAHSKVDYKIAKNHNLPLIQVINEDGVMQNADKFNDMKVYDCRSSLIKDMITMGLLKDIKPHEMVLPICSRTGDVIFYLPKEQWFLSCSQLNKKAAELVRNGKLSIEPKKFVKNWFDWTEDERDWCISRQLWWGHQIPAYKCSVNKDVVWLAAIDETAAKIEASKYLRTLPDMVNVEKDNDVLDTWFSSGIYPFAAMGWPHCLQERDYSQFYPLNLMVTGHDILGFWVHRMVILGLELTGQLPFDKIFLHGVICDNYGAKMSKSKGNVIDPIDVIEGISLENLRNKSEEMHKIGILTRSELNKALLYHKVNFSNSKGIPECGADALRFTLLSQDVKSHFVNFDIAMCHANKLFCNKIWQSVKYTQLSYDKLKNIDDEITIKDLTIFDKWILSRLANMVEIVNNAMDDFDFHLAVKAIRKLIYNEFCDVYLEATKPGFDSDNPKIGYAHAHTLSAILNTSLRCLAPFMIYLTDELIPKIPAFKSNIICNFNDLSNAYLDFPEYDDFIIWKHDEIEIQVEKLLGFINIARGLKGLYNITKIRPTMHVKTSDSQLINNINSQKSVVNNLARIEIVKFERPSSKNIVKGVLGTDTEIFIELVGEDAETNLLAVKNKLEKRKQKLIDTLSKLEAKLSSDYYVKTVPETIKKLDREKLQSKKKLLEELKRLTQF